MQQARALFSSTSASHTTAVGFNALAANTWGEYSVAVGSEALSANQTGNNNTAVGYYALAGNQTGSNNIGIGYNAGKDITSGKNNIAIGTNSRVPANDGNDQISIANLINATGATGVITSGVGAGNVGIGTNAPTAKLDIAGQIRIRGGGPVTNYVLTAVDGTGLAVWKPRELDPVNPVTTYYAGNGLTLDVPNATFELGGALNKPTTIDNVGNSLTITGPGVTSISTQLNLPIRDNVGNVLPLGDGKVLTSDEHGNATWQDPLVVEPWYKRGTKSPSTENTDHSYLNACVAIGYDDFPATMIEGQPIRLFVQGNTVTSNDLHVHHRLGIGMIQDGGVNEDMGYNGYVPKAALHILSNNPKDGGEGQSHLTIETFRANGVLADQNTPTINFKASRGSWENFGFTENHDVLGRINFFEKRTTSEESAPASIKVSSISQGSAILDISSRYINLYGDVTINGGSVGPTYSDRRLKTNITPSKYGLSEIMKLQPVNYEMKSKPGVERVGFIAQEVKEVIPEVVNGTEGDLDKKEILSISYGEFAPVLTKAIQEQQAQIEAQQSQIDALQTQNEILLNLINTQQKLNEQLEARLKALEAAK